MEQASGPHIIEIPFRNLWPDREDGAVRGSDASDAAASLAESGKAPKLCAASRANGMRCTMLAEKGKTMCSRHERWYRSIPPTLGMPYPEDAFGLQDVMAQVVAMVLNRELDAPRAKVVAQLCQVMQRNLKEYRRELLQAESEEQRWTRVQ